MKQLLLTLALGTLSMTAAAQAQPTIYGSVVFGHQWEDMGDKAPYGVYSLPADNASQLSQVKLDSRIKALGGGVYVDGHYYLVDYSPYNYDGSVAFRIYDADNGWKLVSEKKLMSYSSVASDLAYDPTTDKIFGCFRTDPTKDEYFFGTFNPVTGFSSKIANLKEELMAIACTRDGKLYAVGSYGMLYSVDKANGALTEIGQTGKSIKYAQSATFDYASGRMLWAMTPHYTDEQPEICEVNLSTGKVTTLTQIPNRYQFTGIFTTSSYAADNAPARPEAMKADFAEGSLTGNITFSMPSKTMDGSLLNGKLAYRLAVDGETASEANAEPGKKVSVEKTLTQGMHYIKVTAIGDNGRSPFAYCDFWAGTDFVNPVSPKVEKGSDGKYTVSWTAPATSNHGGYFNAADITYTAVRYPDNVEVYKGKETAFTDNTADKLQLGNYYYSVTADAGAGSGDAVSTNTIQIGTSLILPYEEDFTNFASAANMTVEDTNNDGCTWEFFGDCMICGTNENGIDDNDDWLITPAFNLSRDSVYQVSVNIKNDESYKDIFEVKAGKEDNSDAMLLRVIPETVIESPEYKTFSGTFVPEEDGECHIGIHDMSKAADGFYIYINRLSVKVIGSVKAPAAVENAKAEALGAEHRVKISFNAPRKNMMGNALTETVKSIEVKRTNDEKVVKTFENVTPGNACEFEDTPEIDGNVGYSIIAENNYGHGSNVDITAYVGYDTPGAVTDAKLTADDEGNTKLTWKAPMKGIHGGVVNTDGIKYNIGNVNGSSLRSTVVTEPSFSEKMTIEDGQQRLAWYTITPETEQGKGPELSTDTLFVGKPYVLPFAESFAKRSMQRGPWRIHNTEISMWDIMAYGTYADASDTDNGLIAFSTMTEGATAQLISPKITLKDTRKPKLKFWVYNMQKSTHSLKISVMTSDGKEETLDEFVPNDTEMEGNDGEWKEMQYDLSSFNSADYVQLIFSGTGHMPVEFANTRPMYLDQISIVDPIDKNLSVSGLYAVNDKVKVGEDVELSVEVNNGGAQAAEDFSVMLYRNGTLVSSQKIPSLESEYSRIVKFTDCPNSDAAETSIYKAVVNWEGDEVESDNTSNEAVVSVLPGMPYIEKVTIAVQTGHNALALIWDEPKGIEKGTTAENVTEDFESYVPFTIRHFGEWTLTDADHHSTIGIQDGKGNFVQYDNVEAPMAYQIFNPTAAKVSTMYFPTHSGKQVAAAFSSGRSTANDDWLISPEVDGEQTIKFWACSPDASYYNTKEQIEVLYSTTDTETASFKKIGATITVPGSWTQYPINLPAGTRYFAIRCVSKDQYILFIDDITYRKAARDFRLQGYNIYRNDELIGNVAKDENSYFIGNSQNTTDVYKVSAVYNTGESRATVADWGISGITDIEADGNGGNARVYDLSGRMIPANKALHGVYIIKDGKQTRKVIMK